MDQHLWLDEQGCRTETKQSVKNEADKKSANKSRPHHSIFQTAAWLLINILHYLFVQLIVWHHSHALQILASGDRRESIDLTSVVDKTAIIRKYRFAAHRNNHNIQVNIQIDNTWWTSPIQLKQSKENRQSLQSWLSRSIKGLKRQQSDSECKEIAPQKELQRLRLLSSWSETHSTPRKGLEKFGWINSPTCSNKPFSRNEKRLNLVVEIVLHWKCSPYTYASNINSFYHPTCQWDLENRSASAKYKDPPWITLIPTHSKQNSRLQAWERKASIKRGITRRCTPWTENPYWPSCRCKR